MSHVVSDASGVILRVRQVVWSGTDAAMCLPQACTNTILAHFASIVFANWLQKTLLKPQRTPAKPQEPDYTQRRGPSGAAY